MGSGGPHAKTQSFRLRGEGEGIGEGRGDGTGVLDAKGVPAGEGCVDLALPRGLALPAPGWPPCSTYFINSSLYNVGYREGGEIEVRAS